MDNQPSEGQWVYNSGGSEITPVSESQFEPITWTGSEFIAEAKSSAWYAGLAGFILLACVIIFFVSRRDIIPVIFIAIMGILFGIIAGKQPRQLQYTINEHGIGVGARHFPFHDFKSFSVQHDGAIGYISLMPLHRMKPELSIYFPPEEANRIFDSLARYLPNEQRSETIIDRLVKRIRF